MKRNSRDLLSVATILLGLFLNQAYAGEFRLKCDANEPSIGGVLSCADLKRYLRAELRRDVGEMINNYYRGQEVVSRNGATRPVKVPICNFAAGECSQLEWAQSVRSCNMAGSDCTRPPSLDEVSLRNYNSLVNNTSVPREMRYGGSFCTFRVNCGFGVGGDFFGCEVQSQNTCAREFAWYRGLYPQAIWKSGEEVINEITAGGINLIGGSGGDICGAAMEAVVQMQQQVDAADMRVASDQLSRLRAKPTFIVENCKAVEADNLALNPDSEESMEIGQAAADAGYSRGICKVTKGRMMLYKAMASLVSCEAAARGSLKWQNFEAAYDQHLRELQDKMVERCYTDNNERLNNCYRREVHLMAKEKIVDSPEWRTAEPAPSGGTEPVWGFGEFVKRMRLHPTALQQRVEQQLVKFNEKVREGRR